MLLWLIEETGWRVYYFDSQAFALSLADMERFEFAALYTLPHFAEKCRVTSWRPRRARSLAVRCPQKHCAILS
jgi:hypothetical protein